MIGTLNRDQIDSFLRCEVIGRIGCSANGKTYVVPITYIYDGKNIYAATKVGMKTDLMRQNPNICFEVDHIRNMANWQSVIAWGKYEELEGKAAEDALQSISNRIHPISTSETSVPRHGLERPHEPVNPEFEVVVFQIKIKEVTGKFEKQ
ncbi:MAG: pyridoxamine 5'-phosphate oxidase family protein [Cyclobacteriaceae bacterium]|jgi:nitroimidazol reductase NimA-like FMN-containing flavoprotein (pyridoxamine 5'-phosphate oxidase superfamily)|nr:pyridoxamine 5'-phosphate oxidase family protein [Cyclobacteriaceae bacterium]MDH4298847.1 pyridoxamine 5'-phosphate oxidase family protein [Cyclobacteriaceae bacterium]MDH5250735.1 pyridoxamine 5'-phosphate oxidase family protein [Cyclobacteriaceae bacterium]